ncbi:hypothetical protein HYALB_00005812 [Hymenoscyphus albidus]|uniref:CMP/dCMP-type deaminase domain-containing protein n=1 Tax=Hymenoscyphus albidus TaxID=595503 RepID=A0A9N9LFP2_9HELO|nr:hypothetical protein HYALB_00005812 [Hymenoscyphus albidus]
MTNQETRSEEENAIHLNYMREALSMAELALHTSETPVGCVIVHPSHGIIGRGMNATNRTRNGTMHAEFIAINEILSPSPESSNASSLTNLSSKSPPFVTENEEERKSLYPFPPRILNESTLYVTVEPCIMCASLLRQFGIKRVFFGASNEKFGGTGGVLDVHLGNGKVSGIESNETVRTTSNQEEQMAHRRNGDYEVSGGWLREEAIVMLRRFYVQENGRAPEPRRKADRVLKLEVEPLEGGGGV